MRSAKKHIKPVDMEIIYRAYRAVWAALDHDKRPIDSDEARALSANRVQRARLVNEAFLPDRDASAHHVVGLLGCHISCQAPFLTLPFPRPALARLMPG
jgi:hypothetical protein